MKILDIADGDWDIHGEWLTSVAESKFRAGGYTHVRDGRAVMIATDEGRAGVLVGEHCFDSRED